MKPTKFANEGLKEVFETAVTKGYKVFTSETQNNDKIKYILITDGIRIGYCEIEYGAVKFSTVHKPTKGIGTGFGDIDFTTIEEGIEQSMSFAPSWVNYSDRAKIVKYKNVEEYFNKETVLKYYYIDYIDLRKHK